MPGKKNKTITGAILFLVICLFGFNTSFAYIYDNGAGSSYTVIIIPEGDASYSGSNTIEDYIKQGAGYYLKAKEDFDRLLEMVEAQDAEGPDWEEMKRVVDSALTNMNNAANVYNTLINEAESTPYDNDVVAILSEFDYNRFMISNGLNSIVFGKVESYLKNGDTTGVFKYKIPVYTEIVSALNVVKADVYNESMPGLTGLWNLNETFSECSLFGSYVARIFHEIN
ncbi:MAG: hypothetical protein GY940_28330 [bacterium]|nr:hypothetical protein [bacterium]